MFGNPEETIQLTFDFGNTTEKAGQVTKSLQDMQAASDEAVRRAVELTQAQKAMGVILEEVSQRQQVVVRDVRETATAPIDFGRTILNTSFAVQDFTSQLGTRGLAGALGAVQNNIPMILTGLGMGAGLSGVVSIASVGVGVLANSLSKDVSN